MVQDEQEKWDIVIKPRSGLFRLDLEEVWLYRDLLVMSVFLPTDFPNRCFIWRAYFAGIISRSV